MSTGEQSGKDPKPASSAKFWLKSALVIVAAGILLAWAWTPSRPEEPVYQGKTLTEWLIVCVLHGSTKEEVKQAELAVRNIGTNGIPTLLRMIQASDSNPRFKLQALAEKLPFIRSNFAHAGHMRYMASLGFKTLGEDAKGAVPELLTLVKRGSGTAGREEAINALGAIGPSAQAAIPTLLAIASDKKDQDRWDAISSLGRLHSSAETVVPVLESCLGDSNLLARLAAVWALSEFGEAAKSAVPSLIPLMADPNSHVREKATNALKRIDREAATKAGIP